MIDPAFSITNYKIVSAIRSEIVSLLAIDSLQRYWTHTGNHILRTFTCVWLMPYVVKVIWVSLQIWNRFGNVLEWFYKLICRHCIALGIRRPRNKYADGLESYLSYCKKRKRKVSRTRMLKHRMIRLLEKFIIQKDEIHKEYGISLRYIQGYQKRLFIIRKILVQVKELWTSITASFVLTVIIYVLL